MEYSDYKPAQSFRDLRVWQEAYKLAILTYKTCEKFPNHERFALTSQMTRAAVSVCSNIAEGFGRRTAKEKDQFYGMANGSLTELENQILIAQGITYITDVETNAFMGKCDITHRMLITLMKVNREKGK